MARKNLCPYKDGEDNLGKKGKAWGNTHTKNLYVTGEAEVQKLTVGDTATIPGYVKDVTKNGNTITVTKGGGESTTFNAGLNILARNKSYSVGDIAYSPNLPSYLYLECTTAGTTGATEPDMSTLSAGVMVDDGTAKFSVKTVCAKEYVDAKASDEVAQWKKAYNSLRKRSYPTEFDADELTLLASDIGSGTITLSQPYTNFDGLLIDSATDSGDALYRHYISVPDLQNIIRYQRLARGRDATISLVNCGWYWQIYVHDAKGFTPTTFPSWKENCLIKRLYGVKFKDIT